MTCLKLQSWSDKEQAGTVISDTLSFNFCVFYKIVRIADNVPEILLILWFLFPGTKKTIRTVYRVVEVVVVL